MVVSGSVTTERTGVRFSPAPPLMNEREAQQIEATSQSGFESFRPIGARGARLMCHTGHAPHYSVALLNSDIPAITRVVASDVLIDEVRAIAVFTGRYILRVGKPTIAIGSWPRGVYGSQRSTVA